MEQNEITMAVDVKLDLKERRSEFQQFRVSQVVFFLPRFYFHIIWLLLLLSSSREQLLKCSSS